MAKMTKTQQKNAYKAILSKAQKLWQQSEYFAQGTMSTQDLVAIEKMTKRYLNRLK